jgi:hypothetical protein
VSFTADWQIRRFDSLFAVQRVEGIVGRVDLSGVQRVVRYIATSWIENVVVALIFLGETGFGRGMSSGKER